MLGPTSQVFDIQTVRAIEPSNGAIVLTFGNGLVARIPPAYPDRDSMLREAENSRTEHWPVGVLVNREGSILELSHAHETGVNCVREAEEEEGRLPIWFAEELLQPELRPEQGVFPQLSCAGKQRFSGK
jgi:hypothetical protein